MKPILYLHIGTGKTATSALQSFFFSNSIQLLEQGVLYPTTGLHSDGSQLIAGISLKKNADYVDYLRQPVNTIISGLTEEIRLNAPEKVLISTEFFSSDYNEVPDCFWNLFDKVVTIIYLRRIDTYSESHAGQSIKTSYNSGSTKFASLSDAVRGFSNFYYFDILNAISKRNGKENLIIRPFERQQFQNNSIIDDFQYILEVEINERSTEELTIVNRGLSYDQLELLRLINCHSVPKASFPNYISNWNSSSDSNKILSPSERANMINKHEEDYHKIATKLMGREDGRLFYDALPDPNESWEPYPGLPIEKVVQGFCHICAQQEEKIVAQQQQIKQMQCKFQSVNETLIKLAQKVAKCIFSLYEIGEIKAADCHMCYTQQDNNMLHVTSTGNDPCFPIPNKIPFVAGKSYAVLIDITAPCDTNLQLFYRNAKGVFSSQQCKSYPLCKGKNNISLSLDEPAEGTMLRLDPGAHPGEYKITKLSILEA